MDEREREIEHLFGGFHGEDAEDRQITIGLSEEQIDTLCKGEPIALDTQLFGLLILELGDKEYIERRS